MGNFLLIIKLFSLKKTLSGERCLTEDFTYLAMLDINGIHDYIFGTNKLREMRGASILLDNLNRVQSIKILEDKKYITKKNNFDCIIANGGIIKIGFKNGDEAEEYINDLKALFNEKASGVGITVEISKKDNSWSEEQWIDHSERKLQKKKLYKQIKNQTLTSGYFKTCQACGIYPAEEKDEDRFVCKVCNQKIQMASEYQKMEVYNQYEKRYNIKYPDEKFDIEKLPKKFSDIGLISNPNRYIGFIYADGNKMGKHIEKIKSFDGLKKFSNQVDKATIDSSVTAIMNNLKKGLDFQIILAGGDDLIIAVPAQKAISVAIDFCEEFNKQFYDQKEDDRVTTSAAVILCHDTMPIKNILESAEGLLKNAKSKGAKEEKNISYIDYLVTSGSALGDPISIRNNELKEYEFNGRISLTMRPYSIERLKKIIYFIKKLKEIDFPKNKLITLYGSLFNGYSQAIIESLYLLTRLKKHNDPAQYDLIIDIKDSFELELFPWNKIETKNYQTPFIDMIELYEFIDEEKGK